MLRLGASSPSLQPRLAHLSQHPLPRDSLELSLTNALSLSSYFLNWLLKLKWMDAS